MPRARQLEGIPAEDFGNPVELPPLASGKLVIPIADGAWFCRFPLLVSLVIGILQLILRPLPASPLLWRHGALRSTWRLI